MKKFILFFVCCYILFLSVQLSSSLKCRTGNQQSDDQLHKIMQVCRRRFLGYDKENGRDYNVREIDSQESLDSDENRDLFDNKFLSSSGYRYNRNEKMGSVNRYDYSGSSPYSRNMKNHFSNHNLNSGTYLSNNMNSSRSFYDHNQMNLSRKNMRNGGKDSRGDNYAKYYTNNSINRNNNNSNNDDNNNNNYYNDDGNNNDGEREQAVDRRGFPEKSSVIGIMTQNIQDSELRDFVENSVVECYRYLNNNGRQDKCQFCQNLLLCVSEKGSERCEDWDDN